MHYIARMEPNDHLPFIDTHRVQISASPDAVYAAVWKVLRRSFTGRMAAIYGRLMKCQPPRAVLTAQPEVGISAFRGFAVTNAAAPTLLHIAGSHRCAQYCIEIALTRVETGTVLAVTTRAAFPGVHGRVYRAFVIGSRGHVLAMRGLLRAVARQVSS